MATNKNENWKTYSTSVARRTSTEAARRTGTNAVVEATNKAWAAHFDHGADSSKGSGTDRWRRVGIAIAVIGAAAVGVVDD